MWIFTKYGFFSAVCARKGKGEFGQPVDPNRIMVRARMKAHLMALKKRFPIQLGNCEVREEGGDYACRIFVDKPFWREVLSELANETDYDNFKSEVADYQGAKGGAYVHSLHDVWGVMAELQR